MVKSKQTIFLERKIRMNIVTASAALVLIYVWILLCILMNVRLWELPRKEKILFFVQLAVVAGGNQILRMKVGPEAYGKLLIFVHFMPFLYFSYQFPNFPLLFCIFLFPYTILFLFLRLNVKLEGIL